MLFVLSLSIMILPGFILAGPQKPISIFYDQNNPTLQFVADDVSNALNQHQLDMVISEKTSANILFEKIVQNSGLVEGLKIKPEGFVITKTKEGKIIVSAMDDAGLMYGGLELAEQINLYGLNGVKETRQNPYIELRGVKLNIPLDVRTPSYSDMSDVFQYNLPEVWNFDFWKVYLNNLARNRYNLLSLWNLHPFPSLVKVTDYPDVALDDIWQSTTKWKEFYDGNGVGFDSPEILANPNIVKKMTIDEKIAFWQKVMKYAKERNIRVYIMTWNIFVYGTNGKYGITDKIDNPVTQDYFRKSIRQMFVTYPDLAGIGLTTGENMPESSFQDKEKWAFNTFGKGVIDAVENDPSLHLTLIHRQHQTGAQEIAKTFSPLIENKNIEFLFSFKYAQAHVMSTTNQTFHQEYIRDIKGLKTLWTLRNDDNYYFRWAAPDFVREFIQKIPMEVTKGFYYGSDQYFWGRDFLSKEPLGPNHLENEKQWLQWLLWARLGYDPELPNSRFTDIISHHFSGIDGKKLLEAWQSASMIYPLTTGFHWGSLDFQWYIEACKSSPVYSNNASGFHDVNRFISLPPHPGTSYQSIPDFVKTIVSGEKSKLISPLEVSKILHSYSDKALKLAERISPGTNEELKQTLEDIKTMAWLGKYYAFKINGATNLELYRETGEKKYRDESVRQLTQALEFWINYTQNAMSRYKNPLWTNRVGYVDWLKLTEEVRKDIEIAKSLK
jgi:hypothetical protein